MVVIAGLVGASLGSVARAVCHARPPPGAPCRRRRCACRHGGRDARSLMAVGLVSAGVSSAPWACALTLLPLACAPPTSSRVVSSASCLVLPARVPLTAAPLRDRVGIVTGRLGVGARHPVAHMRASRRRLGRDRRRPIGWRHGGATRTRRLRVGVGSRASVDARRCRRRVTRGRPARPRAPLPRAAGASLGRARRGHGGGHPWRRCVCRAPPLRPLPTRAPPPPCINRTPAGVSPEPAPTLVKAGRSGLVGSMTSVPHDLDPARGVVSEVPEPPPSTGSGGGRGGGGGGGGGTLPPVVPRPLWSTVEGGAARVGAAADAGGGGGWWPPPPPPAGGRHGARPVSDVEGEWQPAAEGRRLRRASGGVDKMHPKTKVGYSAPARGAGALPTALTSKQKIKTSGKVVHGGGGGGRSAVAPGVSRAGRRPSQRRGGSRAPAAPPRPLMAGALPSGPATPLLVPITLGREHVVVDPVRARRELR